MLLFLVCVSAGGSFLTSFLLLAGRLDHNPRASQWLAAFVATLGLSFSSIYLRNTGLENSRPFFAQLVYAGRFLTGPLLYLSIGYFMFPTRSFRFRDTLHFIPFVTYLVAAYTTEGLDHRWQWDGLPVADYFLPLQTILYAALGYRNLIRHRANMQLISADTRGIDLTWLRSFLLILALDLLLWVNEIFLDLTFLVRLDPFIYTASVYFLAYYALKQRSVFSYAPAELQEITEVFEEEQRDKSSRPKRLSAAQLLILKDRLYELLEREKIFLENDLSLPMLAQRLGIGIHDASFLVNEVTGDTFYQLINRYRVEEAKRLLASNRSATLNMLGIGFAAGFNSKTTFNTTFRKMTGQSPSEFARTQKK